MTISIIIPTYNSAATLRKAIDSIVCQSFIDWEVLIMDGASKDDTIKIAQSYNDSRIRIYSEPDKGIYDAMNKGIKKAQGNWLYFLGSDDWLLSDNVLQDIFSLNINDYDIVYGDVEAPHLATVHFGEWNLQMIDYNRCHQAIFYRRTIFTRLGKYNLKYKIWADYDLNLKWFFSKKIKKTHIPIVIAHYTQGGYSSQCDKEMLQKLPWLKLFRGKRMYSAIEKKKLINEVLNTEKSQYKRLLLKIWRFFLTTKKQ